MAFVNNLWGATASFEDDQVTDVTPGDVNEQVNDAIEVTDTANAIDNGTEIISQAAEEIEALTEVQDKNEEVIADAQAGQVDGQPAEPAEVEAKVEAQLQESQEALNDALLILGGKGLRNRIRSEISPSFEAAQTKLDLLRVSNEGIGTFIHSVWKKFLDMLNAIWNFIKKIGQGLKRMWNGEYLKARENAQALNNATPEQKEKIEEEVKKDDSELAKTVQNSLQVTGAAAAGDGAKALETLAETIKATVEAGQATSEVTANVEKAVAAAQKVDEAASKGQEPSEADVKAADEKAEKILEPIINKAQSGKSVFTKIGNKIGQVAGAVKNGVVFAGTAVVQTVQGAIEVLKPEPAKEEINIKNVNVPQIQKFAKDITAVVKDKLPLTQEEFDKLLAKLKKEIEIFSKRSKGEQGVSSKAAKNSKKLLKELQKALNVFQKLYTNQTKYIHAANKITSAALKAAGASKAKADALNTANS